MPKKKSPSSSGPSVFAVLRPYALAVVLLSVVAIAANGLLLWLPRLISQAIDAFLRQEFMVSDVVIIFGGVSLAIFALSYLQSVMQAVLAERVARDLRNEVAAKISDQPYSYVQEKDASKLLTNLTSDMDAVKLFVSQGVVTLLSSAVLILGASVLLLAINWKLGAAVLLVVPLIGVTFFMTLRKVRELFTQSRTVVDGLNRVISESVFGAALIRVLHSVGLENTKFKKANGESLEVGMRIVGVFASLIPLISLFVNMATILILLLGGHFILQGSLSIGDFAAFNSYLALLVLPVLMLGFVSNILAQANASYARVAEVLAAPIAAQDGGRKATIKGDIEVKDVTLRFGQKIALQNASLRIAAGSRTAIIGPTAAGKSQLLYVMAGLLTPESGEVRLDGHAIAEYDKQSLHSQLGLVFQDSITFNLSLRENIAFSPTATDKDLELAIATAELQDLIASLPEGLDTVVSERGVSLSGGQRQRVMLARALALRPKVLLLDDFTARVDPVTEAKILANVHKNYPNITLVSVTQKIASVMDYDQIILLMEGEVLAAGTHQQLLDSSPEYMQIYNSQRSTTEYEL